MDKKEMGERIAGLSNNDGKVLLDDFAQLVFEKDSPDDVVKKFIEEAPKLVTLQKFWGDLQKTVVSFNTSKGLEREQCFKNLLDAIENFKNAIVESNMEQYIHLPQQLEDIYQQYNSH